MIKHHEDRMKQAVLMRGLVARLPVVPAAHSVGFWCASRFRTVVRGVAALATRVFLSRG